MTKEQFKQGKEKADKLINDQKIFIKKLHTEYIEANKVFSVGDRVNVLTKSGKDQIGYIYLITVGYNESLKYFVKKEKKDGTPSTLDIHVWFDDKIIKAPKDTA